MDAKILIVDDEPNILNALKRILRKEQFDVTTSESPIEALKILEQEQFKIILSDQKMPDMIGADFLERTKLFLPNAIRILLTGYSDVQAAMDAINKGGIFRYLTKPWQDDELILELRRALYQYDILDENRRLNQMLEDMNLNLENIVEERTQHISRLNQELRKSFTGIINLLANISQMHSNILGNHSSRVAKLSKEIAKSYGLNDALCFKISIAATLHDIGEIGISPGLLDKSPLQMNEEESRVYLSHALISENIISQIPFLSDAAQMVRHHHEHFNGTGFPDKLKGEQIPIGSRIIAVADAFDLFLNAKNSFTSATPANVLLQIKGYTPAWYDPKIVSILETLVQTLEKEVFEDIQSEIEVRPNDLKEGMILSKDLKTSKGVLILPKNTSINTIILKRILNYDAIGWTMTKIYIKRT